MWSDETVFNGLSLWRVWFDWCGWSLSGPVGVLCDPGRMKPVFERDVFGMNPWLRTAAGQFIHMMLFMIYVFILLVMKY